MYNVAVFPSGVERAADETQIRFVRNPTGFIPDCAHLWGMVNP
jgi:hypothetical protein